MYQSCFRWEQLFFFRRGDVLVAPYGVVSVDFGGAESLLLAQALTEPLRCCRLVLPASAQR